MFHPKPMEKVLVSGPNSILKSVTEELHKAGAMHITDHDKTEDLDIGNPFEESETYAEASNLLKSLCSNLDCNFDTIKRSKKTSTSSIDAKEIIEFCRTSAEELKTIREAEKKTSKLLADIQNKLKTLEALHILGIQPESIQGIRSIAVFIGTVQQKDAASILKHKIPDCETIQKQSKEKNQFFILAVVPKDYAKSCSEALDNMGYSEIPLLPEDQSEEPLQEQEQNRDIESKIMTCKQDIDDLTAELSSLKARETAMRKDLLRRIPAYKSVLEDLIEISFAPLRFASTRSAFIVTGWVPKEQVSGLKNAIAESTGNRAYFRASKPDTHSHESIPVELDNPRPAKPFQFIMDLYTLPKFEEIDPTPIVAITFPLFFGFILGDMGYGITTLALFWLLNRKFNSSLLRLMMIASASSIFFGALFGEFFGAEQIAGIPIPRLLSRIHAKNELMIISVVIGVFHVNLGLVLGFINELKHAGLARAILEKGSWMLLEIGIALAVLAKLQLISAGIWFGISITIISIVMLYLGEGAKGLVELPSIFGNILSYIRLMAVALASVGLAVVVNDMALPLFHSGIGGIIAGTFLLVIGHTINIGLGILGGFLHSVRLHYVEFFTKFFKGGGIRYSPFGLEKD